MAYITAEKEWYDSEDETIWRGQKQAKLFCMEHTGNGNITS